MGKSLMEMLIDAGYPREEMFHHESDLYVYATPLASRVIDQWCKDNGSSLAIELFNDQITGRTMYDIAFQYIPYWEEKCGKR